jgi:phospholipid/cholesterol/gamma-HCH transport system substrate-binding protein
MARKRLAWAELRVGILVISSFTILAVAIVLISGGTGFFTEKYELKTFLASASGLRKGSLVWLAGLEVGNVSAVTISTSTDSNRAVEVTMQVEKRYSQTIGEDSVATLGSIGLLGDKYIDISRRSPSARPIPPGGEVKGSAEADIKKIMQNSNDLVANLGDLVNKIKTLPEKSTRARHDWEIHQRSQHVQQAEPDRRRSSLSWPPSNPVKGQSDGSFLTGSSMTREGTLHAWTT